MVIDSGINDISRNYHSRQLTFYTSKEMRLHLNMQMLSKVRTKEMAWLEYLCDLSLRQSKEYILQNVMERPRDFCFSIHVACFSSTTSSLYLFQPSSSCNVYKLYFIWLKIAVWNFKHHKELFALSSWFITAVITLLSSILYEEIINISTLYILLCLYICILFLISLYIL